MIWHIIILTIVVVICNIWCYNRENDCDDYVPNIDEEAKNNEVNVSYIEEKISTRQLALRTIENIGSKPEYTEEGRIQFEYQGIVFLMEASNDCFFINIYDLWWYHISTYCDLDEFAAMQKTINRINAHVNCTVLYTINQEAEEIGVHSKKNMLFVRQIPDLKGYLISTLNDFFKVQRSVMTEIEKCKVTEEQQ